MSRRGSWHLTNTWTACPFPVWDRKSARSRKHRDPKNTLLFMFYWTWMSEHNLYCASACVPHGSCNFVLSHSFPPKSPIKTMPVFVFSLLLLYLYCCVLLHVCVTRTSHLHTRSHRLKFYQKTVGCYDYKLALVLTRFQAIKGGTFILSR